MSIHLFFVKRNSKLPDEEKMVNRLAGLCFKACACEKLIWHCEDKVPLRNGGKEQETETGGGVWLLGRRVLGEEAEIY